MELLPADVLLLRGLLLYLAVLLVVVVGVLWARVAAGRVLDEHADDLARVRYDAPLTIMEGPA